MAPPPAVQTTRPPVRDHEAQGSSPRASTSLLDSTRSNARQIRGPPGSCQQTGRAKDGGEFYLLQRIAPIEYPNSDRGSAAAGPPTVAGSGFGTTGCGSGPERSQVGHGRGREDRPNATLPETPSLTRPLATTWRSTSRPAPICLSAFFGTVRPRVRIPGPRPALQVRTGTSVASQAAAFRSGGHKGVTNDLRRPVQEPGHLGHARRPHP